VLEPFAITEGVTPTTRYRKNGKKAHKSRNSAPTRIRSAKSAVAPTKKSKCQTQHSPGSVQDMKHNQRHHTPIHHCISPIMDNRNLPPYTPNCHQLSIGSQYQSGPSILDNLGQYADMKPGQINDEGMVFMDEHEHYGDRYPYVWTNSHCY